MKIGFYCVEGDSHRAVLVSQDKIHPNLVFDNRTAKPEDLDKCHNAFDRAVAHAKYIVEARKKLKK